MNVGDKVRHKVYKERGTIFAIKPELEYPIWVRLEGKSPPDDIGQFKEEYLEVRE